MFKEFHQRAEPSEDPRNSSEGIVSPTSSTHEGDAAAATPIIDDMGVDDDQLQPQPASRPPASPSSPIVAGDGGGIVAESWAIAGPPNVPSTGDSHASESICDTICDDPNDYGPRLPPIGSMDVEDSPDGLMANPFDIDSAISALSDAPPQGAPGLPPLEFSLP